MADRIARAGWLALAICLLAAPMAWAGDAPAIVVPGQFTVTPTGAFVYTVAINVPPGTAGMAPSLSLDYSSQGGDGFEGLGWSLSGLPSVTRCARTIAQDGVHGSVNYDTGDQFCLDGARLISKGATSICPYQYAGTEYRTEIDGFSRVVACGSTGVGPSYFLVWTKSGQIMEFGNTADSQGLLVHVSGSPTGPSGTVRTWAVDKISDTVGNYLKIVYDNGTPDAVNGQIYPTEIDYTANDGQHLVSYNSVKFTYTDQRNDVTPVYQAGAVTRTTKLLTHISTYAGSALVSDYALAYQYANRGDQHDELSSVTLCDGSTPQKCLKPTSFTWQGSRDVLTMTKQTLGIVQGDYDTMRGFIFPGDFDGDGLTDFAAGNNKMGAAGCNIFTGQQSSLLSFIASTITAEYYDDGNGDGGGNGCPYCATGGGGDGAGWVAGPACFSGVATRPKYLPRFLDFDGNGLADVLKYEPEMGNTITALYNDGQGHLLHSQATGLYDDTFAADFDGDGRTDVMGKISSGGNFQIYQSTGTGSFTASATIYSHDDSIIPGDFDGDGCMDILQQVNNNVIDYAPLCRPAAAHANVPQWLYSGNTTNQVVLGDFNGDGKTDVLAVGFDLLIIPWVQLYLSTGTGLTQMSAPDISFANFTLVPGDFNGDGKTDLLLVADDQDLHANQWSQDQLWLSTGTGFVRATNASGAFVNLDSGNDNDKPVNHIANIRGVVADWNNDGASDIWLQKPSGDAQYSFAYVPEMISAVTNGIGITTTPTYDRLNKNAPLYTKCPGGPCNDVYPTSAIDGAVYVVSRVDSSNAIGGTFSSTYAYGGAKFDLTGRGFLGFQSVSVTDLQSHIVQTSTFRQDFPFLGLLATQTKVCPRPYCRTDSDVTLYSLANTYQGNGLCNSTAATGPIYTPYLCTAVTASNNTDGSALPSSETDYDNYDAYGNVGTISISTTPPGGSAADAIQLTTNSYTTLIDSTHWCLGRLMTSSVKSTWNGTFKTRHTGFDYDLYNGAASTCLITKEIIEPGFANTNLWQETDNLYDGFGNKQTITVLGCADAANPCTPATPRVTSKFYDTTHGQFPITTVNANNQTEHWTFDPNYGGPTSHKDVNNFTTSWQYDGFGRKLKETNTDGTYSTQGYNYCTDPGISCVAHAGFLATNASFGSDGSQNGPSAMIYYDGLSRTVSTDIQGFDGSWIRVDTLYDLSGRQAAKDRPYFRGDGTIVPCTDSRTACTTYAYDAIGRAVTTTAPDHGVTTTAYTNLTETVTNALGEITVTTKNDLGKVASVTDALAQGQADPNNLHTTRYTYDPFGNTLTATDPAGNTTTNSYDIRGRKTKSVDPDMGTWLYGFDSFGEPITQTDPNETHNGTGPTTSRYDVLGRLTDRVEPDMTAHWDYDGALHGVGKIQDATCSGSACGAGAAYTRTYQYDLKGRPNKLTIQVGANAYFTTTSYDPASGKKSQIRAFSTLVTINVYNIYGYLSEIDDANNLGLAYYKTNARDAELHVISQTAGNGVTISQNFDPNSGRVVAIHAGANDSVANLGYQWDQLGDLNQRTDMLAVAGGQTENFCYDKLNRVTGYSLTGPCGVVPKVQYDALGNITSKYDVGSYTYGNRPHAVASIATGGLGGGFGQGCTISGGCTVNGTTNPVFNYDRDGNMLSGAGRTVTYTSFNMTSFVGEGTTAVALAYDTEHDRIQQATTAGGATSTTTYLNDSASGTMTERIVPATGQAIWKSYIKVEDHVVAVRNAQGSTVTVRYFVNDHLGSVSVVTDENGLVVSGGRLFYDAWGKMRAADGSPDTSCVLPTQARANAQTTRGYTGQEQIPEVCLTNYNARIYDPQIGRFMSADPKVQDGYNLQSLNRYSYVLNNPLSLTDPTGYCSGFFGCLFAFATFGLAEFLVEPLLKAIPILGDLFVIAAGALCGPLGPLCAAVASAGVTGAEGGKTGDVLRSFVTSLITAEAFYEVGQYVDGLEDLAHDGANAVVSNTEGALIRIGLHGFVGGLSSVASGGKFGSGFLAAGIGALADDIPGSQDFGEGLVIHAVAGGVGSVLGGGKFGNGAITGAFGYLFNKVQESTYKKSEDLEDQLYFEFDETDEEFAYLYKQAEIKVNQDDFLLFQFNTIAGELIDEAFDVEESDTGLEDLETIFGRDWDEAVQEEYNIMLKDRLDWDIAEERVKAGECVREDGLLICDDGF